MELQLYTSEGLPLVTEAMVDSLVDDFSHRMRHGNPGHDLSDLIRGIHDSNHGAYNLLVTFMNNAPPEVRPYVKTAMLGMYEGLRRQAKYNQLLSGETSATQ